MAFLQENNGDEENPRQHGARASRPTARLIRRVGDGRCEGTAMVAMDG